MIMATGKAVFALILASALVADTDNEHGVVMFGLCSKGQRQSPVNINTNEVAYNPNLEALDRDYVPANATLVNHGYHIALLFDKDVGTMLVDGMNYSLKSVHWHSPSEHTIDGQRYEVTLANDIC